ncbi:MAG: hypothetical protein O7C03_08840 [Gammaproteobacteria bacterium]|nr:hypothetical protein [Gammaproteobacteria bacterium]
MPDSSIPVVVPSMCLAIAERPELIKDLAIPPARKLMTALDLPPENDK